LAGPEVARAAVERYVGGVHDGSTEAWVGAFAPDAVVEDPVGQPSHVGTEALREFWDNTMTLAEAVHFDVERIIALPGEAVMVFTITASLRNGGRTRIPAVGHYRVGEDGLITHYRAFWDPATVEFENW